MALGPDSAPAEGICDCGAVTIRLAGRPDGIFPCPCRWCRRIGAQWGYLPKGAVDVSGETDTYLRATRRFQFHRCATCGVTTHWRLLDADATNSGVNMTNFATEVTESIPILSKL